ncbi:MAG: hypothetical protein AABX31_05890, partial [Nanoarchaeota archaeon]
MSKRDMEKRQKDHKREMAELEAKVRENSLKAGEGKIQAVQQVPQITPSGRLATSEYILAEVQKKTTLVE